MTCAHDAHNFGPRMRVNERGMRVFDSRTHFDNQPNSKRQHKEVLYFTCSDCGQVGFKYYHSRVIYTWNREDVTLNEM